MEAAAAHLPRAYRRLGYAALALVLVALIVFQYLRHDVGWWPALAFGLGPDLPLLLGAGKGLERGQIHPRAVLLYNLAHRFWSPLALGIVAVAAGLPAAYVVGALAWATHIAVDRSLGYSLRTRDGFQRS